MLICVSTAKMRVSSNAPEGDGPEGVLVCAQEGTKNVHVIVKNNDGKNEEVKVECQHDLLAVHWRADYQRPSDLGIVVYKIVDAMCLDPVDVDKWTLQHLILQVEPVDITEGKEIVSIRSAFHSDDTADCLTECCKAFWPCGKSSCQIK